MSECPVYQTLEKHDYFPLLLFLFVFSLKGLSQLFSTTEIINFHKQLDPDEKSREKLLKKLIHGRRLVDYRQNFDRGADRYRVNGAVVAVVLMVVEVVVVVAVDIVVAPSYGRPCGELSDENPPIGRNCSRDCNQPTGREQQEAVANRFLLPAAGTDGGFGQDGLDSREC